MSADGTASARCAERVSSHASPPQRAVVPVSSILAVGLSSRYRAMPPRAARALDGSRNLAVLGWNPTGPVSGSVTLVPFPAGQTASGGTLIRLTGGTPLGAGFPRG